MMVNFLCKSGVPFSSMSDRERERERERERASEGELLRCLLQTEEGPSGAGQPEGRVGWGVGGSVEGRQIALSPANIYQSHPCNTFFLLFF
jgi:hypothetical protein